MFAVGIAIFTLASAAAAFGTDPTQLIIARAVQGLGGAGIMPLSLSLLAGSVEPRRRPLAIGIWGGIAGLGVAVGPLIGGAVVEGWNWQGIFWINVPVGIIAIPIILAVLPNAFGEKVRADIVGVLLAGLGVLGIVFGIVRGNPAGWDSAEVLGSLIAGAVLLAAFFIWEMRARRSAAAAAPVPRPQLLGRQRGRIRLQLRDVRGRLHPDPVPADRAGALAARSRRAHHPVDAGADGRRPDSPASSPARIGTRTLIVAGPAVPVGRAVLARHQHVGDRAVHDHAARVHLGRHRHGPGVRAVSTAVLANMRPEDSAKASGTNSTLREIGVALGIAVLTAVFTGAGGS